MPEEVAYCEMCGKAIDRGRVKQVFIEGALLRVCEECYSRIMMRRGSSTKVGTSSIQVGSAMRRDVVKPTLRHGASIAPRVSTSVRRSASRGLERYELVEDYAERIRRARERLGWSTRVLAMKVRESETTIKRIESGKLRPTIELARRLEEVLGVKLLVPSIDEEIIGEARGRKEIGVTLGEVVNIRED